MNYSHYEKGGMGEVPNFMIIWLHLSANFLFCLSSQINQCLVLGIFFSEKLLISCSQVTTQTSFWKVSLNSWAV